MTALLEYIFGPTTQVTEPPPSTKIEKKEQGPIGELKLRKEEMNISYSSVSDTSDDDFIEPNSGTVCLYPENFKMNSKETSDNLQREGKGSMQREGPRHMNTGAQDLQGKVDNSDLKMEEQNTHLEVNDYGHGLSDESIEFPVFDLTGISDKAEPIYPVLNTPKISSKDGDDEGDREMEEDQKDHVHLIRDEEREILERERAKIQEERRFLDQQKERFVEEKMLAASMYQMGGYSSPPIHGSYSAYGYPQPVFSPDQIQRSVSSYGYPNPHLGNSMMQGPDGQWYQYQPYQMPPGPQYSPNPMPQGPQYSPNPMPQGSQYSPNPMQFNQGAYPTPPSYSNPGMPTPGNISPGNYEPSMPAPSPSPMPGNQTAQIVTNNIPPPPPPPMPGTTTVRVPTNTTEKRLAKILSETFTEASDIDQIVKRFENAYTDCPDFYELLLTKYQFVFSSKLYKKPKTAKKTIEIWEEYCFARISNVAPKKVAEFIERKKQTIVDKSGIGEDMIIDLANQAFEGWKKEHEKEVEQQKIIDINASAMAELGDKILARRAALEGDQPEDDPSSSSEH